MVEHDDAVGALDRRQAMRDHDRRASLDERLQRRLDMALGFRVERRGRRVGRGDGRGRQQRARDGGALPLPT